MKSLLAPLLLIISFSSNAITIEKYNQLRQYDPEFINAYMFGLGEAYGWSSTLLEVDNQKPIFCPPLKLSLGPQNYISILDAYIKDADYDVSESQIELLLYYGLQLTFPCEKD